MNKYFQNHHSYAWDVPFVHIQYQIITKFCGFWGYLLGSSIFLQSYCYLNYSSHPWFSSWPLRLFASRTLDKSLCMIYKAMHDLVPTTLQPYLLLILDSIPDTITFFQSLVLSITPQILRYFLLYLSFPV